MSDLTLEEHRYLVDTATSEVNRGELTKEQEADQKKKLKTAVKLGLVPPGSAFQYEAARTSLKSKDTKSKKTKEQPKKY